VVEVLVALAFGLRGIRRLEPIVTVNVITNPALNLILALVSLVSLSLYRPTLVVLEVLVVLVEWLLLRRWLRPPPAHLLWLVVVMNAASLAAGFLILWL